MRDGRQYRAYPDAQAIETLPRWIGHQRFVYNAKVREDRYFRAFQRRFVALAGTHAPLDQAYAHVVGEETAWLREAPSQILRNGAVRFAQAYSRFFQGLARRPTIQSKYRRQSLWVTRELFSREDSGGQGARAREETQEKMRAAAVPHAARREGPDSGHGAIQGPPAVCVRSACPGDLDRSRALVRVFHHRG